MSFRDAKKDRLTRSKLSESVNKNSVSLDTCASIYSFTLMLKKQNNPHKSEQRKETFPVQGDSNGYSSCIVQVMFLDLRVSLNSDFASFETFEFVDTCLRFVTQHTTTPVTT